MTFVTLDQHPQKLTHPATTCVVDVDRVAALTEAHYPAADEWLTTIHLDRGPAIVVHGRVEDVRCQLERDPVLTRALDPLTARDDHRRESGHEHIDIFRSGRTAEARCRHHGCTWTWTSARPDSPSLAAAAVQTPV